MGDWEFKDDAREEEGAGRGSVILFSIPSRKRQRNKFSSLCDRIVYCHERKAREREIKEVKNLEKKKEKEKEEVERMKKEEKEKEVKRKIFSSPPLCAHECVQERRKRMGRERQQNCFLLPLFLPLACEREARERKQTHEHCNGERKKERKKNEK